MFLVVLIGKIRSAVKYHSLSLAALFRPLPDGIIDTSASIMWNIVRQCLHILSIDQLVMILSDRLLPSKRSDIQDVRVSAKHAALAYHDLQLTYLYGHMPADKHVTFDIALSCVNMAECAGNEMDNEQLAQIYAATAMQSRKDHSNLPIVTHVLLSRMRKSCTPLPADLQWLTTADGQDFFFSSDWSQMAPPSSLWTKQTEPGDFCGRLASLFRQQLLHNGFLNLTVPDANTSDPDIDTAISEFSLIEELSDSDDMDEVCCWWARVGQVACYLVKKDVSKAKDVINKLQLMPARPSGR
jgi:sterol regulatory element-binding transcription factor 1